MAKIKVKHIATKDDWEDPKDGSSSWIDYWDKHSKYNLQDFCRDCGKKISGTNIFVGAHVKKVNSTDNDIYIVPTCKSCNTKGMSDGHEFECDEVILVHANKNKL